MVIIPYTSRKHDEIVRMCVHALQAGKLVAYPTDTLYGLAADATNIGAVRKLYALKGRGFRKPTHVVVPSISHAKRIVTWNGAATVLAKNFLPGPLTVVLGLRAAPSPGIRKLSAGTGTLGIRMPKNKIALALAGVLGRPITATGVNPAGLSDCYSVEEIMAQYKGKSKRPDIIINAGHLPVRKPSTLVKVEENDIQVLRKGPISERKIRACLQK